MFCSEKDRIGRKIGGFPIIFRSDMIRKQSAIFRIFRFDSIGRDWKVIGSRSQPIRSIGSSLMSRAISMLVLLALSCQVITNKEENHGKHI